MKDLNRNVFEIHGLDCAYGHNGNRGQKVVLHIEHLCVPMGKVSVILGRSGSGKSTLIETLGLMNNSIGKGVITYHYGENVVNFGMDIWKRPADLANLRNRHFSFIFQNDFLMPHYSPEENMMIGKLIQDADDRNPSESVELEKFCRMMGLNFNEISTKKVSELSVGQRQRLSFIRASVKNYSVIFGDEPTGNLDEINSELLMDVLIESIKLNDQRSVILVSHNIPLSIAKAGCIIVLSPVTGEIFEIRSGNVFLRSGAGWLNGNNEILADTDLEIKIREAVNVHAPLQ